jgi:hypothetical protein
MHQTQLPTAIEDRQQQHHQNQDTTSEDKVSNPTGNNVTSDVSTSPHLQPDGLLITPQFQRML